LIPLAAQALGQAPSVTNIAATQHDGQTFITWTDAATGATGANYRYNVYRSTTCPITNLDSATLVQRAVYNNSGQLIGPKPFNQNTRQSTNTNNSATPMSVVVSGGPHLPLWTGLSVYTNLATATACYAVITHDITGVAADSPVAVGNNSMTGTVTESVGAHIPVLQIPGTDSSRTAGCSTCAVTSASVGQPLWLKLHASGGNAARWGDDWAYWGDSTMGYQDGTQAMFAVYQDTTGTAFNSGIPNQLILTPQDAVWSVAAGGNIGSANAQSETYWYGNNDVAMFPGSYVPPTDTAAHVYPFTKNKLSLILPWAIAHYGSDVNRIFGQGESMGGYGTSTWSLRQPNTFAGLFLAIPILGPWSKIPQLDFGAASGTVSVSTNSTAVTWVSGDTFGNYLPGFKIVINGHTNVIASVTDSTDLILATEYTGSSGTQNYSVPAAGLVTIATTTNTLPDGTTTYNSDTDTPTWVSQNCARTLPYIAWAAGRTDTTTAGMWGMSPLLANALRICHYGFSFTWDNDKHSSATGQLLGTLEAQYVPVLNKSVSYPAFTNFSLDSNYGNGNPIDGDCNTGTSSPVCFVNYGWAWTRPADTPSTWSTTLTNSQVTSGTCPTNNCATTATVDITARNTQSFKPSPGASINWTASGGQGGVVTTDSYGLVTVTSINLTQNNGIPVPVLITLATLSTTTTSVVSSVNPSAFDQSVTFTASVTPQGKGTPTGTVTFYDGGTALGTVPLTKGSAALSTSALVVGMHSITASYSGDSNFSSSTSPVLQQTVQQAASTTSISSSLNPSTFGQSVTFSATVNSQYGGTPTGTVTFYDGTTALSTVPLTNGSAALTTSVLLASKHSISADYTGDNNFLPSNSSALNQVVNASATTSTLASSADPAAPNHSVTYTATVTSQYGGGVTGTVTFKDGNTPIGTVGLTANQAAYSTSYTTIGTHSMTAAYSGDANNSGSTSPILKEYIENLPVATTTKVATSGSPSFINQLVTFTATITSSYGAIPDGESVTFYDDGTAMGNGTTANGVATFSTAALSVETHTIKGAYPGDASFKASSGIVGQVVNLYPSTTTVTSDLNPSTYGQAVTLTATVSSGAPGGPTGTVTFENGNVKLGTVPLGAGVANLITATLLAGVLTITAIYSGDAQSGKSSGTTTQTVNQATTTTTLTSSVNPSKVGQLVKFTATVISPTTTPVGTVKFLDGSNVLGTANLAGGKASYSTSDLGAGSHSITAVYNGTVNILGSTSTPLIQTVN
jgi:hypothetical protein